MQLITIGARFNGPPHSANGGYTCGLLAALVGEPAEVTLRLPPPLETPLRWDGERLWNGEQVVAECRLASLDLDAPGPVSFADATLAAGRYPGHERLAYPTCFVCGPQRPARDGLAIFAGPVEGRDVFAAPWVPREAARELAWAALDCPGAYATGYPDRGDAVLGRMTGEVSRVPNIGEHCVVVAWALGDEGRKRYAGTALWSEDGELLGRARQTWIALT
jgi:hypothetical protein